MRIDSVVIIFLRENEHRHALLILRYQVMKHPVYGNGVI